MARPIGGVNKKGRSVCFLWDVDSILNYLEIIRDIREMEKKPFVVYEEKEPAELDFE